MMPRMIRVSADYCKPFFAAGAASAIVRTFLVAVLAMNAAAARSAEPAVSPKWLDDNIGSLTELYRHFHQTPELSLAEKETSARLAEELRAAGAEVTTGVGGFGVVGVLKNRDGKTLMIRTDLDALPVAERTGLPYASKVVTKDDHGGSVGVMHACGHDLHITNLVGVARYLNSHRDAWKGTVVFVGQPAEEKGSGARAMLNDGLFVRFPRPDFALALHDSPDVAVGKIEYHPGYAQANVDSVDILVKGRGGHGAYPETSIDPIVIAAKLVLDLQTIVSREIKPSDPAVVTVGSIHGGTKHNVIGDDCKLQLTIRSYSPEVRKHLLDAIRRKALAAAASAGAPEPEVTIAEGTPALYNDPQLMARVVATLKRLLGDENVTEGAPSMGGEDFSEYGLAGVPICMFRLGAVKQSRLDEYAQRKEPPPPIHSPLFYPDAEDALRVGVPAMVAAALDLLAPAGAASAEE